MKKLLSLVLLGFLCSIGNVWGANGDVLFSQNFNSATEVAYTNGTATNITSSSSNNIVGTTATSQFSNIEITAKASTGFAINTISGGNSVNATGFFQAYCNATGQKWALYHNTGFAASAPTAIKVEMDMLFKQLSSGSDYSVTFAIGDGFSNGTSSPSSENVHSGFSILNNSTPKLTQYASKTSIYDTGINHDVWISLVWIINNTGDKLEYANPTGSGTTELNNDSYDIWKKTQAGAITTYTKIVSNQAAKTASKTLQNLYVGDPAGKKNEFRLDNIVITDLTPTAAPTEPLTVSFNAGSHGTYTGGDITEENAGEGIELPDLTTLADGYMFNGWFTASSGGAKAGNAGGTYKPSTDIELYAQYSAKTYTITLDDNGGTADGSATATYNSNVLSSLSAPIWAEHSVVGYYKEAGCTNLIADAEGNLQANTDYTDASGNWTSTSNQTLYAKWLAANDATFSAGAYIIGGAALDLSSLFEKGNGESVVYSVKNANGTGASIAGSNFTATTAGTATVTATQAASGSVAGVSLDAEITVAVNPLGEHAMTWTVKTGTSQTALETASKSTPSSYLNALSNISLEGLSVRTGGGKDNSSPKIETPSTETSSKYTYVTFNVASGYKFILNKVSTKLVAVSNPKTVKCEISDNMGGSTQSSSYTQTNNNDPGSAHDFIFDSNNIYSGTVTIKLYIWGAEANDYRLGKPLTVSGIVVEEDPASVSLNGTVKYATYHNYNKAYIMPEGLEGITISGISGSTLTLSDPATYKAGDIVPAHEPLILHAPNISSNTDFNLYLTYTANEPDGDNKLKGLETAGETTGAGVGGKYYRLTWDGSDVNTLGFGWGAEDGAAFNISADKAYLALTSESALAAPSLLRIVEEDQNATDIESIEANEKVVKFIENGRILILRDGITYDALGRVIR